MRRTIRPDMTVRQLAHDSPGSRAVLRRYGIAVDAPPYGPMITLERLARQHNVPLEALLQELAAASGWPVDRSAPRAHRPFVLAALAMSVLLGGTYGLWLSWFAGLQQTYAANPTRHALSHGILQLWGFVVPFIVGIATRWLPMAVASPPVPSAIRHGTLATLITGTLGVVWWCAAAEKYPLYGTVGSALLFLAALAVAVQFGALTVGRGERKVWSALVVVACGWLAVAAGLLVYATWAYAYGPDSFPVWLRLAWSAVLLKGFVFNCIFGFGLRILPPIVGAPVRPKRAIVAAACLNGAVGLEAAGFVLDSIGMRLVAALLQPAAVVAYVAALPRLPLPRAPSARPEQGPAQAGWMIRFAFGSLAVAFVLEAGIAVLELGARSTVDPGARTIYGPQLASLELYDAARHAMTLGFVTGMIIGVGSRLLPMLEHRILQWDKLVWPTFGTLAVSFVLRVGVDLAGPWRAVARVVWPAAGVLAWISVLLFSLMVLRTFWPGDQRRLRRGIVTERTPVALLLAEYPSTYDFLVSRGVGYLERVRSVPTELTLGTLLRSEQLPVEELLHEIRRHIRHGDHAHASQPQQA